MKKYLGLAAVALVIGAGAMAANRWVVPFVRKYTG